jgi:hypothetical protein
MKPAPLPKHETVLKQLRNERNAEHQRLYKLQVKVVEKLCKASETRVVQSSYRGFPSRSVS